MQKFFSHKKTFLCAQGKKRKKIAKGEMEKLVREREIGGAREREREREREGIQERNEHGKRNSIIMQENYFCAKARDEQNKEEREYKREERRGER